MGLNYFGEGLFGLGAPELIIILVILLLLFGGKKLPELAKSIGTSVSELKKGVNDGSTTSRTTRTNSTENSQE